MLTTLDFQKMKLEKKPISMVTCYDFWTAQILNKTSIDCLLVGDSVTMVMHGYANPIPADVELIALHTRAVVRGAPDKFVVADMPFLSIRKELKNTMDNVEVLMRAGAHALKIEIIGKGDVDTLHHVVQSGVPVVAHLGLTPQAVHQFGGFRMQHKGEEGLQQLLQNAKAVEQAGCFAVVIECVPSQTAAAVTEQLSIPTIGIGAGEQTDGQVLVLQDMLGMNTAFKPKFVKTFLNGCDLIADAVNQFDQEVKARVFPGREQRYS